MVRGAASFSVAASPATGTARAPGRRAAGEQGVDDDDHEGRVRTPRGRRRHEQPEADAERGARDVRECRRPEVGEPRRAVEELEERREGDVDEGQPGADGGEGQDAPAQGAPRPARGRHGHLLLGQRLGEGGRRRQPRHHRA
jgi:hypothetical protein